MVSFATSVLHRYAVAHRFVHSMDRCVELTVQVNLHFLRYTKLLQLYEYAVVADKSLNLVRSIQRIDAVSPNDTTLDFDQRLSSSFFLVKLSFLKR